MSSKRVLVIGAGCSGIVTLKELLAAGHNAVCYEKSGELCGVWRSRNYDCLTTNSSRDMMQLSDFPYPEPVDLFPTHTQVCAYYEAYVLHFGLNARIHRHTEVLSVTTPQQGLWMVKTKQFGTERFDAVVVCSGQFARPFRPLGMEHLLHAADYRSAKQLAGSEVTVVGVGNSSVDIALNLAENGKKVVIACREGALMLPCVLASSGLPDDHWLHSRKNDAPKHLKRLIRIEAVKLTQLCVAKGMPAPRRRLTLVKNADRVLKAVADGRIRFRKIQASERELAVESTVVCTGYRMQFKFLDGEFAPGLDDFPAGYIRLFRSIMHPKHETLCFVGIVETFGNVPCLAQVQARWTAAALNGSLVTLPNSAERAIWAEEQRQRDARQSDAPLFRPWNAEVQLLLGDMGIAMKQWPDDLPTVPRIFAPDVTAREILELQQGLRAFTRAKL